MLSKRRNNSTMAAQHKSNPAHAGGAFLLPCIDTVQGFYFCPAAYQPHTSVYSGVSVDLPNSSAHNTAATQAAYTPPAPHRRAYRQAQRLRRYQIPPTRRTLYRAEQPPHYNKVYKGAAVRPPVMDPCQTAQHITDHASPAGWIAGKC